ncbi:MAG: proline racemase family protein, partial [Gemmatimonadota bacterium]|nr:proline racemase family protein [Gemmatimonadota bacterium]
MELAPVIQAVDAHAAGEPGRVIVDGVSGLLGDSVMEKRLYLAEHGDRLRRLMLTEPRGYPALCCNLVVPSQDPRADWGFIIMEQTEYPAMSGSNTICVATVLIETGMVEASEPVTRLTLEAPAGLIEISARVREGKVTSVTFENVPAFAAHLDATLEVPGIGSVLVDVAWGGMFYVIAEAEQFGLSLKPNEGREISRIGEMLRQAAFEQLEVRHPELPQISGVSISQLSGPPHLPSSDRRNAVVVSTGGLDWTRP